jgi:carbon storage regulator
MLVLGRKIGEKIVIDDNIYVTILQVREGQVRIGIDAPKNIPILRFELVKEVENENKLAHKNTHEFIDTIKYYFPQGRKEPYENH